MASAKTASAAAPGRSTRGTPVRGSCTSTVRPWNPVATASAGLPSQDTVPERRANVQKGARLRGTSARRRRDRVGDVLEQRDGLRDAVGSVAVSRVLFEHRGDGDLGSAERVLEQPPAAPRAVDAALIAGVHEAPARTGINGQVHADTEQLALLADAAHVLAFGLLERGATRTLPMRHRRPRCTTRPRATTGSAAAAARGVRGRCRGGGREGRHAAACGGAARRGCRSCKIERI